MALCPVDGKLVLGKRAINPRKGYWTFPSGYVNRGEAVESATVREVYEETRLEVEIDHLLGLYSEDGNPVVLAAYVVRVIGGTLEAADETSDVGLFATDDLPDLAFPNDDRIVQDWLRVRSQ